MATTKSKKHIKRGLNRKPIRNKWQHSKKKESRQKQSKNYKKPYKRQGRA